MRWIHIQVPWEADLPRLFLQKLNLGWVVDILERYLRLNNLDLEISFLLEYCILMWFFCWGLKIRSHSWGKGYRVFSEGSSDYIINLKASMIIPSHSIFTWQISQFSSVAQSCLTLCNPMDCSTPGFPVHHQLLEFVQTHVCWVCDAIQPSHPLSSPSPPAFNFFPASGSFPVSQFFTSGGQSSGASASASVLLLNIQDWFPLGWTGWICLQSKGLSRVFSSPTVQKHQFFGTQLSLWSNSHNHIWPLEKP